MKSIIAIVTGLLLLGSTANAQQSENKRKLEETRKKAADERSRSFGARSTSEQEEGAVVSENKGGNAESRINKSKSEQKSSTEESSNKGSSDQQTSSVIAPNEDQTESKDTRGANTDPQRSNAPAVIQSTTSESGSPAILAGEDGSGRDGTNNVQRGTLKMAGAEVKGDMGLYKKDASEKNIREPKRIQRQEEQPQRITGRPEAPQNDATVKETAPEDDEAVTKNPEKKAEKKSKEKSKKSRKSKSRDSGR